MEKKLEKLERLINQFRECEDVDAAEHIVGETTYQLMIACNEVSSECMELLEVL